MRRSSAGVILAMALTLALPAGAESRTAAGFRFPPGPPARIIVLRPGIEVGSLGAGGVEQIDADWTSDARRRLMLAIETYQRAAGNATRFVEAPSGAQARAIADYAALFRLVADAIAAHIAGRSGKLPAKRDRFDWSLGSEAGTLRGGAPGDYALFIESHDAYGTDARKVMQVLAAGMLGVGLKAGIHETYAGLVDLTSGDVVWFSIDQSAGGDPRTADGAAERVRALFTGFPQRAASR